MNNDVNNEPLNENEDEMIVTLELEDGSSVNCAVVTILEADDKEYIVVRVLNGEGESEDGEVWFYRYKEDASSPEADPELEAIEDDDEYEDDEEEYKAAQLAKIKRGSTFNKQL